MKKCFYLFFLLFFAVANSFELFAQNSSLDTACIPVININESGNNSCSGTAVTFRASVTNNGTNGKYKWKKNNFDASENTNASYTFTNLHDGDIVTCEYSCKTACGVDTTVLSNTVIINVFDDIAPTITIANYDSIICEGEVTVFTATAYYGTAVPSYHWTVNGSPVGIDSPVFSTSSITNGSRIECVLTISTPSCPGSSKSSSSQMTIYVYPMIHPAITITPNKNSICRGEEVTFTATANGGAYPAFAWKINGAPTGPNAPALTTTALKDGDTVSCTITIDQDSRCHTSTSAPSNEIVVHVHDFIDPTLKIATQTPAVCSGTAITFTATTENAGDYKFYQWQVNGVNAGDYSPTFISDQFKNGDIVSCTLKTSIPGCPITASASSNNEVVTIKDRPVITFLPSEIAVMEGEDTQLHASVSGNVASIHWTPESALLSPQSLTPFTVPLTQDMFLDLTVTDINGCIATNKLFVKILHKLHMPSAFTPNNDGKNDEFRIPADASIKLSQFSVFDRWGNVVFRTTNITRGWNGTYQGKNLDTGTYVYLIEGVIQDQDVIIKGTVTLLR